MMYLVTQCETFLFRKWEKENNNFVGQFMFRVIIQLTSRFDVIDNDQRVREHNLCETFSHTQFNRWYVTMSLQQWSNHHRWTELYRQHSSCLLIRHARVHTDLYVAFRWNSRTKFMWNLFFTCITINQTWRRQPFPTTEKNKCLYWLLWKLFTSLALLDISLARKIFLRKRELHEY